jgi:hypothetical protein
VRHAALVPLFLFVGCFEADCQPVVGNRCSSSGDCVDSTSSFQTPSVCVPVDPADGAGELICAPAVGLARTTCSNSDECLAAGFAIEVRCSDGVCKCDQLFLDCSFQGGEFSEVACGCSRNLLGDAGAFCSDGIDCRSGICTNNVCE